MAQSDDRKKKFSNLTFEVSKETAEAIKTAAKAAGVSKSEYIRSAVFAYMKK